MACHWFPHLITQRLTVLNHSEDNCQLCLIVEKVTICGWFSPGKPPSFPRSTCKDLSRASLCVRASFKSPFMAVSFVIVGSWKYRDIQSENLKKGQITPEWRQDDITDLLESHHVVLNRTGFSDVHILCFLICSFLSAGRESDLFISQKPLRRSALLLADPLITRCISRLITDLAFFFCLIYLMKDREPELLT